LLTFAKASVRQGADQQHPHRVARIGARDFVEQILGSVQTTHERRGADDLAQGRTERRTDLDDRPSRPTAAPRPINKAEASDFATATTGRITPRLL
jgi:hypothetical protein